MKKSLIAAGAASVALAAMPVLGVFAIETDTVTDTINVTVSPSCTFSQGGDDATYSVTGTNASGVVNPVNNSTNVHTFTVFCNKNAGYKVSATATALNQSPAITANFAYAATLPSSGTTGAWHATIATDDTSLTAAQLPAGGAATDVITKAGASDADGEDFTATYTAYIGTATPAGTYSGTIEYTLVAN